MSKKYTEKELSLFLQMQNDPELNNQLKEKIKEETERLKAEAQALIDPLQSKIDAIRKDLEHDLSALGVSKNKTSRGKRGPAKVARIPKEEQLSRVKALKSKVLKLLKSKNELSKSAIVEQIEEDDRIHSLALKELISSSEIVAEGSKRGRTYTLAGGGS